MLETKEKDSVSREQPTLVLHERWVCDVRRRVSPRWTLKTMSDSTTSPSRNPPSNRSTTPRNMEYRKSYSLHTFTSQEIHCTASSGVCVVNHAERSAKVDSSLLRRHSERTSSLPPVSSMVAPLLRMNRSWSACTRRSKRKSSVSGPMKNPSLRSLQLPSDRRYMLHSVG